MSSLGSQWKRFVLSLSHHSQPDIVKLSECAIQLLDSCPVARPAVLELFCSTLDDYMFAYTRRDTASIYAEQLYERGVEKSVLSVLQKVIGLLSVEPDETTASIQRSAPVMFSSGDGFVGFACRWSLNLLGQMSRKYAGVMINSSVQNSSSGGGSGGNMSSSGGSGSGERETDAKLEEMLKVWMHCPVMRQLLTISELCLQSRSSADEAMTALLNASARFSSQFDWVIAHLGSRHPSGIFQRIVLCTLNDFSVGGNHQEAVNKFHSALSVLNHLGGQHAGQLKTALAELIERALTVVPDSGSSVALVTGGSYSLGASVTGSNNETRNLLPFLLMASCGGQEGLRALVTQLAAATLERYPHRLLLDYFRKQDFTRPEVKQFENMAIQLLLTSSDRNTGRIVEFLVLHSGTPASPSNDSFEWACRHLLLRVCSQLVRQLHLGGGSAPTPQSSGQQPGGNKTDWLSSAAGSHCQPGNGFLLDRMRRGCPATSQLIMCRILAQPPGISLATVVSSLLSNDLHRRSMTILLHLVDEVELWQPWALDTSLQRFLEQLKTRDITCQCASLSRLIQLLAYEARSYPVRRRIAYVLSRRVASLVELLYLSPSLEVMRRVLHIVDRHVTLTVFQPSLQDSISITRAICSALTELIRRQPQSRFTRNLCSRCSQCLIRVVTLYPLSRAVALRTLVQEMMWEPPIISNKPVITDPKFNLLLNNPPKQDSIGRLLPRKRPALTSSLYFGGRNGGADWSQSQHWLCIVEKILSGAQDGRDILADAVQEELLKGVAHTVRFEQGDRQVDAAIQMYKRFERCPSLWSLVALICTPRTHSPASANGIDPPGFTNHGICSVLHSLLLGLQLYWASSNCNRLFVDRPLPLTLAVDDAGVHSVSSDNKHRNKDSRVNPLSLELTNSVFLLHCLTQCGLLPQSLTSSLDTLLPHLSPFELHFMLGQCRRVMITSINNQSTSKSEEHDSEILKLKELINALLHNHVREMDLSQLFGDFIKPKA